MLVCHCHRVSDREIRAAVRGGACTLDDVANQCGAGSGCGGCQPVVEEILADERPVRRLVLAVTSHEHASHGPHAVHAPHAGAELG